MDVSNLGIAKDRKRVTKIDLEGIGGSPVGRLYTIPQLLEPERVTIRTKEEFPKYNPGEMVLRLTPAEPRAVSSDHQRAAYGSAFRLPKIPSLGIQARRT